MNFFRTAFTAVRAPCALSSICARRAFSTTRNAWNSAAAPKIHDPVQLLSRSIKYNKPKDLTPLKEARSIYAKIHIYNRNFLVTEGDKILLPVRMKGLEIGNELQFDQVSEIGSADYTLSGNSRIDPSIFTIKGRVVEITRVKRQVKEKTRRRRRHVRHIPIKNVLTAIRISELKLN